MNVLHEAYFVKKKKYRIARPLASALILRRETQKDFFRVIDKGKEVEMSTCKEACCGRSRSCSSFLVLQLRELMCPRSHSSTVANLKMDLGLLARCPSFYFLNGLSSNLFSVGLRQEGKDFSHVLWTVPTSQEPLASHGVFPFSFLCSSQRTRPCIPNCRVPVCLVTESFYHCNCGLSVSKNKIPFICFSVQGKSIMIQFSLWKYSQTIFNWLPSSILKAS